MRLFLYLEIGLDAFVFCLELLPCFVGQSWCKATLRRPMTRIATVQSIMKVGVVISLIAAVGLPTVSHYGISWDEPLHIEHVRWNLDLLRQGTPLAAADRPDNIKYYGVVIDAVCELLYQLWNGFNLPIDVTWARLLFKHYFTFLFSLLAYVSVSGITWILCGPSYAWVSPILLALLPRFWGHSFFNPKDPPFATLFILTTWLGSYLVAAYVRGIYERRMVWPGLNPITLMTLVYGALVGLLTSARVGGFVVLGYVLVTLVIVSISPGKLSVRRHLLSNALMCLGLMLFAWAAIMTLCHPAAWQNPFVWFIENIQYLSAHDWPGTVLFEGEYILATALPWYYLPKWFLLTIPTVLQSLFGLGVVAGLVQYRQCSTAQQSAIVLVLLQVLALPLYAMVRGSTLYDGVRQFLFVLPGVAVFAAYGAVWLYQQLPVRWTSFSLGPADRLDDRSPHASPRLFFVGLLATVLLATSMDMLALHPYTYTYFNRAAGRLTVAQDDYDSEYWGLSFRESISWLNETVPAGTTVIVGGPMEIATVFARSDYGLKPVEDFLSLEPEVIQRQLSQSAFYYVGMPRWSYQKAFPDCPVVYQVRRQDVMLTSVQQCGEPSQATTGVSQLGRELL